MVLFLSLAHWKLALRFMGKQSTHQPCALFCCRKKQGFSCMLALAQAWNLVAAFLPRVHAYPGDSITLKYIFTSASNEVFQQSCEWKHPRNGYQKPTWSSCLVNMTCVLCRFQKYMPTSLGKWRRMWQWDFQLQCFFALPKLTWWQLTPYDS